MPRPVWVQPGGQNHPFNIPINPANGSYWYGTWRAGIEYPASWSEPVGIIDPFGTIGDEYAYRLFNYGTPPPSPPGNFNCRGVNYTYPLYYVEEADDIYTIQGGNSAINGTSIPFNALWASGEPLLASCSEVATGGPSGSDAQIIVVEKATGKEWDLWRVYVDVANKKVCINNGSVVGTEIDRTEPGNVTANIYTKNNGWKPSRGIGINYLLGLVVPEEITAGEINHALSMPSSSIAKTFYLPPATKLEHSASVEPNNHPIPEGARFYLSVFDSIYNGVTGFATPEEALDAFIAWKHASKSAQIKAFIKIVGVALFKFGWFITDTSGAAGWQFESRKSAGTLWTALGIDFNTSTIQNCLDGLIIPPINNGDGTWKPGNIKMATTPANYLMVVGFASGENPGTDQLIYRQLQGILS